MCLLILGVFIGWDVRYIPTSQRLTRPRYTKAQPTKATGLAQPKTLARWVRAEPPYMLYSPTVNFRYVASVKMFEVVWILLVYLVYL